MKKSYIRVSTEKQNEIRQLEKAVKEYGAEKIYIDKKTGKNTKREQLHVMLSELEAGDIIYIHEISRLARSVIDLKQLVDEIINKGATVTFLHENMTFSKGEADDPLKQLMFNMLGSFAEFERAMIVSRVKEGVAIAKSQGKYKGRQTELCMGGKDEARYKAIIEALNNNKSIEEIRKVYKVGMGQIYRIKKELD